MRQTHCQKQDADLSTVAGLRSLFLVDGKDQMYDSRRIRRTTQEAKPAARGPGSRGQLFKGRKREADKRSRGKIRRAEENKTDEFHVGAPGGPDTGEV